MKIGRHTKGNAQGVKAERPMIRKIPLSRFETFRPRRARRPPVQRERMNARLGDLLRFYANLDNLEQRLGGVQAAFEMSRPHELATARRLLLHGGRRGIGPIQAHTCASCALVRAPRHRDHPFHAIVITHSTAS